MKIVKQLAAIVLTAFILGNQASAEEFLYDNRITAEDLKSIQSVEIKLVDNATGACWTNLKEVREYAEEKLRMKGIKVSSKKSELNAIRKTYQLIINVYSVRLWQDGSGPCIGSAKVDLYSWFNVNGWGHVAALGSLRTGLANETNSNRRVVSLVGDVFDRLPK